MFRETSSKFFRLVLTFAMLALWLMISACGKGPASISTSSNGPTNGTTVPGTAPVNVIVSDAPNQDWAMIGVKVVNISLVPQGGGSPVAVYTPPNPIPVTNLVHLDQVGELLAKAQIAPGTYVAANLTLAGNPGDVLLTASPDPEPGFAGTPGATVPPNQVQILGTQGSAGNLTVPLNIHFSAPMVVSTSQNNILNIEFDLAHPAFLVAHVPPSGPVIWAVNFNGPCRQVPVGDITKLILGHLHGSVNSVSPDGTFITISKVFPVKPATTPETNIPSSQTLQVFVDAVNGTLFYDLDTQLSTTIKNFNTVASSLNGKFVRIAARYQADGSLVAVRMWVASSFQKVWLNPEGHVLHVDTTNNTITMTNEDGTPITLQVSNGTDFFFRVPDNAVKDATPIGTGTGFLGNLYRGFEVHIGVADPTAASLNAKTVDIEVAQFMGVISAPTPTQFTVTSMFPSASDNYVLNLNYISSTTPNGKDPSGNAITGFKWWYFAFPGTINSGASAITNFIAATGGSANFGGTVPPIVTRGISYAIWNDPAHANGWSIAATVLAPTPIPLGTVAGAWVTNANGGSFTMAVPGGTNQVTITASNVAGSATLVFQVDDSNNILTVSPQDLTTTSGLNNTAAHLVNGTPVKVFGVPQSNGSIKAYMIFYFTGAVPIK
jgi:hypothetical protein